MVSKRVIYACQIRSGFRSIKHFDLIAFHPVKDRKLLVPVRCTTRKFHLQKPPAVAKIGTFDLHLQEPMARGAAMFFAAPALRKSRRRNESLHRSSSRSGRTPVVALSR